MSTATPPATETTPHDPDKRHRTILYVVSGVLFLALTVIALVAFESGRDNREARDKAQQLITVIEDAGYPAPDEDAIVNVLGDDGGAVCEDPGKSLAKATLYSQISNGAAGPGMRPVIGDGDVLRAQIAIMRIYCPDQLPDVQGYLEDLKTGDVVNE